MIAPFAGLHANACATNGNGRIGINDSAAGWQLPTCRTLYTHLTDQGLENERDA